MTENKNIIKKIPSRIRPFLKVYTGALAHDDPVIDALITAIKILNGKIRIDKIYHIFVGHSPFSLPTPGEFTYKMESTTAGIVIEHFIFIDFVLLIPYPSFLKVAVILEELVHALLNVTNHPLARQIVSLFYPVVTWNDIQAVYVLSESQKKVP
jgi:hypothetical protein